MSSAPSHDKVAFVGAACMGKSLGQSCVSSGYSAQDGCCCEVTVSLGLWTTMYVWTGILYGWQNGTGSLEQGTKNSAEPGRAYITGGLRTNA